MRCSRHRVARLMRAAGRRGRGKRRSKSTTDSGHALPVAENMLMRASILMRASACWASVLLKRSSVLMGAALTKKTGAVLPKKRRFEVAAPNLVWAADVTFIKTTEGWLYLAVVLDLHSRMIVGWSMGNRTTAESPLVALRMAFDQRHPVPGLMHHSDRGSGQACSCASVLPKTSICESGLSACPQEHANDVQHEQKGGLL